MKIHLTKYGKGTPLVFFHGWGFDSHIWRSILPLLNNSYQIILVDLPGFGLSCMQNWHDFKVLLLQQLPDQFILTGWSMGGLYATRLALEEPNRIKSLVNITSSPRFIADELWPGVSIGVFDVFYKKLSQDVTGTLKDFISLQLGKNQFPLELGHPPSKEGLDFGLEILHQWDLRVKLKDIQVPTCYMFGRLDPITPITTMRVMHQEYPEFNYVLFSKAAHMPFLSHQELFIDEFLRFIE